MENIYILRPFDGIDATKFSDTYIVGKENVWPAWCRMQKFWDGEKTNTLGEPVKVKVYSTYVTSFGRIDRDEELDPCSFISDSNYALAQ